MTLQGNQFVAVGLGIRANIPPNNLQPHLPDGIHLRWAFDRSLGFPWFGCTLLRRPHSADKRRICLTGGDQASGITGLPPTTQWPLPQATVISDQPLTFIDDFPPPGVYEFDLRGCNYLRFAFQPAYLASDVVATIGFLGEEQRECVSFLGREPARGPSPLVEQGVTFTPEERQVVVPWQITRTRIGGTEISGLDCAQTLQIGLPGLCRVVEVELSYITQPPTVRAFDEAGDQVAEVVAAGPAHGPPQTLTLQGVGITRVVISSGTGAPVTDEVLLHQVCVLRANEARKVTMTAYLGSVVVASTSVTGAPGSTTIATVQFDTITAVDFSGADAALVELCFTPIAFDARAGWAVCPDLPAPLGLPITHPDYPCTGNAPVDEPAARARALARVKYGPSAPWAAPFPGLHDELVDLVVGGPASTPMADRVLATVPAVPDPPDPGVSAPSLPARRTLDMVLVATLHPAMAQMLGLYWVDQTAVPGVAYDYLVIADYGGTSGGDPLALLGQLLGGDPNVYGYIVHNLVRAPAPALPPPSGLIAYALPGATRAVQGGGLTDASNNVGLRWDVGLLGPGILAPDHATSYHVWRCDLGDGDTHDPPAAFTVLTADAPVVAAEPVLPAGVTPTYPDNWPQVRLHFTDSALPDGWYSYQVSGIDIFGRHSANSAAGPWLEWTPPPDPLPWYYVQPPGDTVIDNAAVRLLAKLPPPPPAGVEAYALDPLDTTLVRDAAYQAWYNSLSAAEQQNLIGLRVRWLWTAQAARQAPATAEFRIYYKNGRPNTQPGTITAVTAASPTTSDLTTDIDNSSPADTYAGAVLWSGGTAYQVTGSDAGTPLVLHVSNVGRTYATGTVAVTSGSATVTGAGTSWDAGLVGLTFQVTGSAASYMVTNVVSATSLLLAAVFAESSQGAAGYAIFSKRPAAGSACNLIIPRQYTTGSVTMTSGSAQVTGAGTQWSAGLTGQVFRVQNDLTRYHVASVQSATGLTLDQPYAGPASGPDFVYAIDFPVYTDLSSENAWDERIYAVGYDDDVTVGTDSSGNPLRVYEILIPAPADTDRTGLPLTTSLAAPVGYAQVGVSAADHRVHTPDDPKWAAAPLGNRPGNEGQVGGPATVFRVRHDPPPAPVPPPDSERVYATPADYHGHSFYTYRWQPQANLSAHVFRALDHAVFTADLANQPRAAIDASQLALFPDPVVDPRWDAAKRAEVATELNQLPALAGNSTAAFACYQALSNDGLRVLAGLPGNDQAFSQITVVALDPDDPANANRLGPDNPPDFVVDPSLRAYLDTIDGRSSNRYFYRCLYTDGAHNRGALSLSGPPVWLYKVIPPRTPLLTKIVGGELAVELHWASNREPDLASYLVYRTDTAADARDARLMTLVRTESVPPGDPSARPAEIIWTDTAVLGLVTYYYRLAATDAEGNVSPPSAAASGRAHDEALPVPPVPTVAWTTVAGSQRAQVSWTSQDETLLQRLVGVSWVDLGQWRPPGPSQVRDPFSDPTQTVQYRLWARKYTGATARGVPVTLVHV